MQRNNRKTLSNTGRRRRPRATIPRSLTRGDVVTNLMERTVNVPSTFTAVATYTASSAPQYFILLQSAGSVIPRLTDMMNDYQFYRFVALRLTLMPFGGGTLTFAIGYEAAVSISTPSTSSFSDVTQLGANRVLTGSSDSPVTLTVPLTELNAHADKWLTTTSAPTGALPNQGYVVLAPTASASISVYVKFECMIQFKSPVVSFTTLDEKKRLEDKLARLNARSSDNLPRFSPIPPAH